MAKRGRPKKDTTILKEWLKQQTQNKVEIKRGVLPAQQKLIDSPTPYILFQAGSGSGKTEGGALKALKLTLDYPKIRGMVTAPSYKMLQDATVPAYRKVFTDDYFGDFNRTEMRAITKNGCEIYFRTTKDPYMLRGATLGFFHMDEAADSPALAFKILQGRLRQEGMPNQGWITTTPKGFNWVYHEFISKQRANYEVIRTSTRNNVFLPVDYISRLKESYTDDQFLLQELEGEFVEIGGNCPFDMKSLNEMYQDAKGKEPIYSENFGENGTIHTYAQKSIGKRYFLVGDAATGVGEDESAFVVALATPISVEVVCCGKGQLPEAEFAEVLNEKGKEYNDALVMVEAAPVGVATVQKLREMKYPRLYHTSDGKDWTPRSAAKPMLVAELAEAIKDRSLHIPDMEMIEQLMSYILTKKQTFEAAGGARDDYVSCLMLLIQAVKSAPFMEVLPVIRLVGKKAKMAFVRT